jgi:hypothetical protein
MNLEILQTHLERLGVIKISSVCVDGQQAIDKCKNLIDTVLRESISERSVIPVVLCLLDF